MSVSDERGMIHFAQFERKAAAPPAVEAQGMVAAAPSQPILTTVHAPLAPVQAQRGATAVTTLSPARQPRALPRAPAPAGKAPVRMGKSAAKDNRERRALTQQKYRAKKKEIPVLQGKVEKLRNHLRMLGADLATAGGDDPDLTTAAKTVWLKGVLSSLNEAIIARLDVIAKDSLPVPGTSTVSTAASLFESFDFLPLDLDHQNHYMQEHQPQQQKPLPEMPGFPQEQE